MASLKLRSPSDCPFADGRCPVCGAVNATGLPDDRVHRLCDGWGKGLGDRVAAWLTHLGVTEARYRQWKVRWGFADTCGCNKRIDDLNRVGQWVAGWRRRIVGWFAGL